MRYFMLRTSSSSIQQWALKCESWNSWALVVKTPGTLSPEECLESPETPTWNIWSLRWLVLLIPILRPVEQESQSKGFQPCQQLPEAIPAVKLHRTSCIYYFLTRVARSQHQPCILFSSDHITDSMSQVYRITAYQAVLGVWGFCLPKPQATLVSNTPWQLYSSS